MVVPAFQRHQTVAVSYCRQQRRRRENINQALSTPLYCSSILVASSGVAHDPRRPQSFTLTLPKGSLQALLNACLRKQNKLFFTAGRALASNAKSLRVSTTERFQ